MARPDQGSNGRDLPALIDPWVCATVRMMDPVSREALPTCTGPRDLVVAPSYPSPGLRSLEAQAVRRWWPAGSAD